MTLFTCLLVLVLHTTCAKHHTKSKEGKDESKAKTKEDKLDKEVPELPGQFRLTREAVIPVDGGVDIDLEYEATSSMKVYWKRVVVGEKGNYWIPIQGKKDRAKIEHEENRLAEGYIGSSSFEMQHEDPVELKLIATFYNVEGNLLYEYSPDLEAAFPKEEEGEEEKGAQTEKTEDKSKQTDKAATRVAVPTDAVPLEHAEWATSKSGLFTERAIDVLYYPPALKKVNPGEKLKLICSFLVPNEFDPVLEWVRVTYHGMGKDHIFFMKNMTVLATDKEWVNDEVTKDKELAVVTTKTKMEIGTLVISELNIEKVNHAHEGIYTCHITEKTPTPYTFISAFTEVLPVGESLYPKDKIYIKFFTCDDMFKPFPDKTIRIKQGVPNCFSCGGYGYPKPKVGLFKDGEQLVDETSTTEMSVGRDVQAVTYVLSNPTREDQGIYACVATNGKGEAYWIFDVIVE